MVPPPWKKALKSMYRVEMHVHSPISHGNLTEKKIRPITVIVWVVGIWWKKCLKKGKKK